MQCTFLSGNTLLLHTICTRIFSTMKIFINRNVLVLFPLISLQALIFANGHPAFSAASATPQENLEQLIKTRKCRNCVLSGLNMNRLDLSGVDLQGADLSQSQLNLTNLSAANLKNTRLKGAAFGGADLEGADLRGADFQDTSFSWAYLHGARMDGEVNVPPPAVVVSVFSQPHPAPNDADAATEISAVTEVTAADNWWSHQPKEKKLYYTVATAATLIGIWGLNEWDYGSADWKTGDEGWFGEDTKYGGADKLGHFWSTYTLSDGLTGLYKYYGYESKTANLYAAFSAWTVQAVMEVFDGTSKSQGFSPEDMAMNTLGALTSMLMDRYPELDQKIDFRVEYVLEVEPNSLFDDYSNQFYSMVLKLDGFDSIENTFLKYVEIHGGYYSRGYDSSEVEKNRSLYAGISLNFSRLLNQLEWKKTGKVLEYLQVPYTVFKASHDLD